MNPHKKLLSSVSIFSHQHGLPRLQERWLELGRWMGLFQASGWMWKCYKLRFKRAHRPHGDVCYACARYQSTCRTANSRLCHTSCCNHCLKTERGRAQSEEDVHEAWLYNRDRSMDNLPSLLSHATCNLAAFEEGERLCQPFMA